MAALQQQLIDAQQALERDYWRFRQVETRYRLLFRMVSEAILIIDAPTQRVVEANPAAGQLLGEAPARIIGRPFPEGFDTEGTQAINGLLAGVRAAGRADDVRARLIDGTEEFLVAASLLRQENASFLLVRLSPILAESASSAPPDANARYLRVLGDAPDGRPAPSRRAGWISSPNASGACRSRSWCASRPTPSNGCASRRRSSSPVTTAPRPPNS